MIWYVTIELIGGEIVYSLYHKICRVYKKVPFYGLGPSFTDLSMCLDKDKCKKSGTQYLFPEIATEDAV